MAKRLRITQVHSAIKREKSQGLTIKALGFKHLQQTIEHDDTPAIRGMVKKVGHLLHVEEIG